MTAVQVLKDKAERIAVDLGKRTPEVVDSH